MNEDVQSMGDPFELFSQYSPMGRNYGNPVINALMQLAFGHNYMPKPEGSQDVHDSFLMKERSKQFMRLQRSSFSNNMLFKKMGLSGSPFSQMLGGMAGSPDSSIGRAMQPLLGGNPMAASMGLFAGLAGTSTMGAFGRTDSISTGETEDTMQALANNFYKTQSYEGPEGYREESRNKMKARVNELSTTEGGRKKLKDMGLEVNVDESGKLDESSRKKVESFDITAGKSAEEINEEAKNTRSTALRTNVSKLLGESDRKLQSTLYSRFEEQMKAFGAATAKELANSKGPDGRPDPAKVKALLNRYQKSGGDLTSPEAKEARESIAKDITSDMYRMVKAPDIDKKAASDAIASKLVETGLATPSQVERLRKHDRSIRPNEALNLLHENEEISRKAVEKLVKVIPADLNQLNKASVTPGTLKNDLRRELSTKIADFSYSKVDSKDLYQRLKNKSAEEVVREVKGQNAAAEQDILDGVRKLEPHLIADFFKGRNRPDKKQLSDSLEKKLVAEKIVTQDELQGSKKDGVIEYNDAAKFSERLKARQKERVSILREDLAHFDDKGDAGSAARQRLEKNIQDFEVATPEEIQQRRVLGASSKEKKRSGDKPSKAFSKEEAGKLVDRYEEREQTFTKNIDRDIIRLEFSPKSTSKKDLSESIEKKLMYYGVATQEEIKGIKDKDGMISSEGVKELLAKTKKIKKATEDSFKEDIENIKKAPEAGQSKQEISKTIEDRLLKNKLATVEELDSLRETSEVKQQAQKKLDEVLKSSPEIKKAYEAVRAAEAPEVKPSAEVKQQAQKKLDEVLKSSPEIKKAYEAVRAAEFPKAPLDPQKTKEFLYKAEERRNSKVKALKEQIVEAAKTPEGQDKEALNETVEKRLIDTGIVSKEELPKLRDDHGKLDTAKVKKVVETWEKTGASTSVDEGLDQTKLRNRIANKKVEATKMTTDLENISKATDDDIRKALEEKFKKQITEYGVDANEVIDKKTGKVDLGKAKDLVEDYAKPDEFEQEYQKTKAAKEGGGRFKGYNFEVSRGFKLEDFQQAFNKGAELRMFGNSRGRGIPDTMDSFSKNAGGSLSAARTVFGDKPTGELMSNMSALVGTSSVDLTSTEGSEKMEMLLRRVKATAKVAGVSIKAMLSIIDSTKELFSQNPDLQYANTEATTNIALNAVQKAAKLGSVMSAAEYRQSGGDRALVSEEIQGQASYMQSGFGQTVAGILALSKSNVDTTKRQVGDKMLTKHEELLELVKSGAVTPEYIASGEGHEKIKELTGMSGGQITMALHNPDIARNALKQKDIMEALEESYHPVAAKTLFDRIERQGGHVDAEGKYTKGKSFEQFREEFEKSGKTFDEYFPQMQKDVSPEMGKDMQTHYTVLKAAMLEERDPEKRDSLKRRITEQAKRDQELEKEYAGIRSPLAAQFINKMAKGEKINADSAIDAMASLFSTDKSPDESTTAIMEQAQRAGASLASLASRKKLSDKEKQEAVVGINDVLLARKAQALASGDNVLAGKIGTVTEQEMDEASVVLKSEGSLEDAKTDLRELRKQRDEGKVPLLEKDQARLKALETAEKATWLESDKAFSMAAKGGPAAYAAAVMQSSMDAQLEQFSAKQKAGIIEKGGYRVKAEAEREDKALRVKAKNEAKDQALKDGKSEEEAEAIGNKAAKNAAPGLTTQALDSAGGDVGVVLEQRSKRKGFFADEELRKKFDKGESAALLNSVQDDINTSENEIRSKTETESDNPYIKKADELKTAIDNLTNTVNTGGPIGEALRTLAMNLTNGTALDKTYSGSTGDW